MTVYEDLFLAVEQSMKDTTLRRWSVFWRTLQEPAQHEAGAVLPPPGPQLVFAALPGNPIWMPLRLHIMVQILIMSGGGRDLCMSPQIWAVLIGDQDLQICCDIAPQWGSPFAFWTRARNPCWVTGNRQAMLSHHRLKQRASLVCVSHEDRKSRRRMILYLKPMTFEVLACCCPKAAVVLHMGWHTFSC